MAFAPRGDEFALVRPTTGVDDPEKKLYVRKGLGALDRRAYPILRDALSC